MRTIKVICTIGLLFCLQKGYSQTDNSGKPFIIKGKLTGGHMDAISIYYTGSDGKFVSETKPVSNTEFTITGNICYPESARIMLTKTNEIVPADQQEKRMRELYIEPTLMTITGDPADMKSLKITGSKTETEFEQLSNAIAPIREEMKPIEVAFANEKDHEKAAAIHDQFGPYYARMTKITHQFFIDHPNSYVTLNIAKFYVSSLSLDSTKLIYNAFNDQLKATSDAKELLDHIKQVEAGLPGAVAAAFTKNDIHGKLLSLADFKGKCVMLDFWASWCVPCRASNPHMIELYNKYKGKGFDVIGIADDDSRPAEWNAAVAKDGVGIWHNILRGLNMDMIEKHILNPDDLDQQYGIASIPTKILIGPDGKIIGRYGDNFGGTEEDMDKMLASIFDK